MVLCFLSFSDFRKLSPHDYSFITWERFSMLPHVRVCALAEWPDITCDKWSHPNPYNTTLETFVGCVAECEFVHVLTKAHQNLSVRNISMAQEWISRKDKVNIGPSECFSRSLQTILLCQNLCFVLPGTCIVGDGVKRLKWHSFSKGRLAAVVYKLREVAVPCVASVFAVTFCFSF